MDLDETTVKALSTEELMKRLDQCGERTGPITPTTRSLYEKRLLKKLRLNSAAACTISYNTDQTYSQENKSNSADSSEQSNSASSNRVTTTTGLDEKSTGPFYGVRPPPSSGATGRIFTDRVEALKYVKQNANSRFNSFTSRADAENFCSKVDEEPAPSTPSTPYPPPKPAMGEGSPFKSVKPQELVTLRRMIEDGEAAKFKETIWSNPRYLIGPGDNPTVLQPGSWYNAMHICAQKNRAEICDILIETLENPDFLQMMYPDSRAGLDSRMDFILDLYLNTPDKNGNETPLHFACKMGSVDVVEVLAAHPKVDRETKNKYGETASNIVCSRVNAKGVKERINQILEERYFVRLYRNVNEVARISKPWSPCRGEIFNTDRPSVRHTLDFSDSPAPEPMSVRAYAGPMSRAAADDIYTRWTASPQRNPAARSHMVLRRADPFKGFERIGRELAQTLRVPWKEYWSFLSSYTDLRTEQGLKLLEKHLDVKKREIEEREQEEREKSDLCDMFGRLLLDDKTFQADDTSTGDVSVSEDNKENSLQAHKQGVIERGRVLKERTSNVIIGKVEAKSSALRRSLGKRALIDCVSDKVGNGSDTDPAVGRESSVLDGRGLIENSVLDGRGLNENSLLDGRGLNENSLLDGRGLKLSSVVCTDSGMMDEDGDTSDAESFVTAAEDLTMLEDLDDDEGEDSYFNTSSALDSSWSHLQTTTAMFVEGNKPTRTDVDVLRALDGLDVDVNKFPLVVFWRNRVLSYPENERDHWPVSRKLRDPGTRYKGWDDDDEDDDVKSRRSVSTLSPEEFVSSERSTSPGSDGKTSATRRPVWSNYDRDF